jgi:hypothetical protein
MATGYQIAFKDGPRVYWGERVVESFRTRKAAGLLAYLAYHPGSHSRDKLIELFWLATRDTISLNATAFTTDLAEQYSPERFLLGFFDDWVLEAREGRTRTHLHPTR